MIMQPILLTWEDYHDNALTQKKKKNTCNICSMKIHILVYNKNRDEKNGDIFSFKK